MDKGKFDWISEPQPHPFPAMEAVTARARADERAKCAAEIDRLKLNYEFNSKEALALQDAGVKIALGAKNA